MLSERWRDSALAFAWRWRWRKGFRWYVSYRLHLDWWPV